MKKKKYQTGSDPRNLSDIANTSNRERNETNKIKGIFNSDEATGNTRNKQGIFNLNEGIFTNPFPSDSLLVQQTGTEIGKDNYMEALKLFKKGGSK